jgi:tricorn protease
MAVVCNGETGSDGETFTEGAKALKLGPVIGERTWGGWVGIRGDKPLSDRGGITSPEFPTWSIDGKWIIEGWGSDPDIIVVEDPAAALAGKDTQLDYTINYLLKKIVEEPRKYPQHPPYPDKSLK